VSGTRALRRKARRDMRRQRASFLAIALTIFLGVALFGASYDAYRNLDASYKRAFNEYRFANLTVTGGEVGRFAADAAATPGVEAAQARVQADLPLHVGRDKFLGRVVGMPPGGQPAVDRLEVESGSYLRPGDPRGILVEKHMADAFDLGVGDAVTAIGVGGPQRLTIVGVASSPEYFWPARSRQDILPAPKDFGVLFVPERLAAALAGTPQAAAAPPVRAPPGFPARRSRRPPPGPRPRGAARGGRPARRRRLRPRRFPRARRRPAPALRR